MADKKSREVIVTGVESNHGGTEWGLIAITEDGKRYAVTESEYSRLEARLIRKQLPELDFTQVLHEAHSDGSPIIDKDETPGRTIEMKIDVDVSEALTGLKAVQREAREATKAMKELEEISKYNESLSEIPTDTLRRELIKRTGVFEYVADNNGLETVLDMYGNGHGYIDKLKDGDTVIVIK